MITHKILVFFNLAIRHYIDTLIFILMLSFDRIISKVYFTYSSYVCKKWVVIFKWVANFEHTHMEFRSAIIYHWVHWGRKFISHIIFTFKPFYFGPQLKWLLTNLWGVIAVYLRRYRNAEVRNGNIICSVTNNNTNGETLYPNEPDNLWQYLIDKTAI